MDALRNYKNNQPPSCSHSLFIHIFQFDFGCTSVFFTSFIRVIVCKRLLQPTCILLKETVSRDFLLKVFSTTISQFTACCHTYLLVAYCYAYFAQLSPARLYLPHPHCVDYPQGVTKRCRLSWLTNSALVYEPKCVGCCGVSADE